MSFRLANINKILITFSPFTKNSTSAREFLARATADRMRSGNPKCNVVADVRSDSTLPSIVVTWADNVVQKVETQALTVQEIIDEVSNGFERFPEEIDS